MATIKTAKHLPEIPLHRETLTADKVIDLYPEKFESILDTATERYGRRGLAFFDWAYGGLVDRMDEEQARVVIASAEKVEALGYKGGYGLQLLGTGACTAGARIETDGSLTHLRTLDWDLDVGRHLVVHPADGIRHNYVRITMPLLSPDPTGCVPGEYSISLNRAQIPYMTPFSNPNTRLMDAWLNRLTNSPKFGNSQGLPVEHFMTKILQNCSTYDQAYAMLTDTNEAVCSEGNIVLVGRDKHEYAGVEVRRGGKRFVHGESMANHSINPAWAGKGHARTDSSLQRAMHLATQSRKLSEQFAWLSEPVKAEDTFQVSEINVMQGTMSLFGARKGEPVTQILDVNLFDLS